MEPLVSIITPSYNQGKYLEQTIRSVLFQDYSNIEYIIVDGGSTDDSVDIIRRYAKHLAWWVSEPDNGQAEAINKGFNRASGDIVAWINSDDFYYSKSAVSEGVKCLLDNPDAGMVYGNGLKITSQGRLIAWFKYPQYSIKDLLSFNILLQPSVFMRRMALDRAGYLPAESRLLLDHELWIQIAAHYPILHVDKFWGVERSHESAKTVSLAAHYGPDAFELVDALRLNPEFQGLITENEDEIYAGVHIFHSRRLIDAGKFRQAAVEFVRAYQIHPQTARRVWYKGIQAFGGMIGLGGFFRYFRDLNRKLRFGQKMLVVDHDGVTWVSD